MYLLLLIMNKGKGSRNLKHGFRTETQGWDVVTGAELRREDLTTWNNVSVLMARAHL